MPAGEGEEGADREDRGGHVHDARLDDLDRHRRDQADHGGRDAEQERPDARSFSAIATSWRWKKIGKTNAGRKMPRVIASPPGEAAGEVADERREDDQRGRQDAADREPVDELAVGEPAVVVDGARPGGTGSPCRRLRT